LIAKPPPESDVVPVVLCGGAGTRLWPLSRRERPKQLLPLVSERTLIEETLARCEGWRSPVLIGADEQRVLLADAVASAGLSKVAFLTEPSGRNTAAAACAAALEVQRSHPGAPVVLMPADHAIADIGAFRNAVRVGLNGVAAGRIVVFGIRPDHPATGYGYIEAGAPHGAWSTVRRFVEKPDEPTARAYVEAGLLWNAGIFLFRPEVLLAEMARHAPRILEAVEAAYAESQQDGRCRRLAAGPWSACPSAPLDVAIMERTDRAAVVPVSMGWEDLGSFQALWEREADDGGNALVGDAIEHESSGCYVHGEGVLVAVNGVRDLVVVGTPDAVLVSDRAALDGIKPLVARLGERREVREHPMSLRPWGAFRVVDAGDGFQVKRLTVRPGEQLSLQVHAHRSEHWVVVQGRGQVELADTTRTLGVGEHIDIPVGVPHRITNPADALLVLVEIQLGSYLGEDDIERLDDAYGRE
jgi:mannose-1-phosphate guanylyltransferase/mannose-6-phosphate isomerase